MTRSGHQLFVIHRDTVIHGHDGRTRVVWD